MYARPLGDRFVLLFRGDTNQYNITACNKKPHESFDLTVKIANGSYHFAWSESDKSEEGKRMTMLVDNIIGMVEEREEYKRLPAVQGYYE